MRSARNALLAVIVAPLAALGFVGCPHGASEATSDAAPSASATNAASAESTNPSAGATSTTAVSSIDDAPKLATDELDDDDASIADVASLDALDALDAFDADARDGGDARAKTDAPDDAPLMGTKTYFEELPAKGIRKITSNAAKVHKAPKDGNSITSLPKGTEVSLVAQYLDWYRVRYSDPGTGVWRQGWIYVINFAGPRMKSCPEGWLHHDQDGGWCERECTKNTDCKAIPGYKCSGTGCFYATP